MNEEKLRDFLYKNLPGEVLKGLEYDDPKAISRALKMLGVKEPKKEPHDDEDDYHQAQE